MLVHELRVNEMIAMEKERKKILGHYLEANGKVVRLTATRSCVLLLLTAYTITSFSWCELQQCANAVEATVVDQILEHDGALAIEQVLKCIIASEVGGMSDLLVSEMVIKPYHTYSAPNIHKHTRSIGISKNADIENTHIKQ